MASIAVKWEASVTQENVNSNELKDSLRLKLPEPDVSSDQPWVDDVLGREEIAARLTNLIRNQSAPFVISIDGYWGTGKTFLLRRWQKALEKENFKAIYFNAWEDDFCDDPLVAILGQLSDYFEESPFQSLANKVVEVGIPLLKQNVLGVLENKTGITLELKEDKKNGQDPLKSYRFQRATKDDLKKRLSEMSAKVREETGHPMVFIIDELDRCRPTFAIELLERVKHIFDVPNLVFVFGINRGELCSSIQSIYGDIDASVYLRRFFDMGFTLPEADAESFGRHLIQKFELETSFASLSRETRSRGLQDQFAELAVNFPGIWARLGLSLRDIDYCVRLIALVAKNLKPGQFMNPWLLGLLVSLQLTDPTLYKQYIGGTCLGSTVMDYVDKKLPTQSLDRRLTRTLNNLEVNLYLGDHRGYDPVPPQSSAHDQLQLLSSGDKLTHPEYLSEKTKKSDPQRIATLMTIMSEGQYFMSSENNVGYLATLIDLYQEMVRR